MAVSQSEVPWRVLVATSEKPKEEKGKPAPAECSKTFGSTGCKKIWKDGQPCVGCPNRR